MLSCGRQGQSHPDLSLQAGSLSSGGLNMAAFQSADLDNMISHFPPEVRLTPTCCSALTAQHLFLPRIAQEHTNDYSVVSSAASTGISA